MNQLTEIAGHVSPLWNRTRAWVIAHTFLTALGIIVFIGIGYWSYGKLTSTSGEVRYVLGTAQVATVISTVSGSGSVSTSNQVSIQPKVSGTITRVYVHNGETVVAGQELALIDSGDAYQSYLTAQSNLKAAQLSLQKLQEPATNLQLTQSQNTIARSQDTLTTTQSSLTKQYQSTYNDVISAYLDLATVLPGLQDIITGTSASGQGGIQNNVDFYTSQMVLIDPTANTRGVQTNADYQTAIHSYNTAFADYSATTQQSSTSTIESISKETYSTLQVFATSINDMDGVVQAYTNMLKTKNLASNSTATAQLTNLATYLSKINTDISNLSQDINTIASDKATLADSLRQINENNQSLAQLQQGTDPLDIQSSELSVQQRQIAVQQAAQTLGNYTIRAPFDGVIGDLALVNGQNVGSGSIATEISSQQIADLSLNEVDAAKLLVGQRATLSFDAIPDLILTGKVADMNPIGTVTQGVVSYDVKIAFDASDPRVRPGMTVSADVQTVVHSDVLTVPTSAIKSTGGRSTVSVFSPAISDTGGTAGTVSKIAPTTVPVTVGISDGSNTEILTGLKEGDQIVTRTLTGTITTTTSAAAAGGRAAGGGFGGGGGGGIRL
ncbi:MAG: family efflux transporter subunit, HlyD family secretion protein [Candidatus Kaiserbacteria bacterium]|nr:family efflux transporter subunit, HlyD family secretion protein [Candidatus Kaiserbacteria bacterium]